MQRQNNRVQSDLFREALPVTEKWEYLEAEWKPSDRQKMDANKIVLFRSLAHPKKGITDKKVIDWELGYAMTIRTSQGMTLKAPQSVWVIDENLAWDNLIYLAVGQIEEAKKNRRLEHELRPSIQEKLIGYMSQDKEKGHEFNLTVDYILILKHIQEDKCALYNHRQLNWTNYQVMAKKSRNNRRKTADNN
uniref:Uncharacterized protein n=1 Tax=Rhizophagus irregularis (strain DAOM 181602 / DAOM 197198 / MUCL 43194) TaxID=747089 RepID=U9UIP5_RHIID